MFFPRAAAVLCVPLARMLKFRIRRVRTTATVQLHPRRPSQAGNGRSVCGVATAGGACGAAVLIGQRRVPRPPRPLSAAISIQSASAWMPATSCTGSSQRRRPRNLCPRLRRTGGAPVAVAWQKRTVRSHRAFRHSTAHAIHLVGSRKLSLPACPAQRHDVVAAASSHAGTPATRNGSLAMAAVRRAKSGHGSAPPGNHPASLRVMRLPSAWTPESCVIFLPPILLELPPACLRPPQYPSCCGRPASMVSPAPLCAYSPPATARR